MTMFNIEDVVPKARYGACMRKHAYTQRKYAVERADLTSKGTGTPHYVYKCPYCGLWHVSHLKHEIGGRDA